jgi:hypothetical protein
MNEPRDAYWDDLGVTWSAINPDIHVITPRLQARLRQQSRWITAGLLLAVPLVAAGVLLGVVTLWSGWSSGTLNFVTRGMAILAVSFILAFSASLLLPVRSSETASALSEMIELAVRRAHRSVLLVRWGLVACGIAAVFGLVGTAIRTHLAGPPRMSPIVDLTVLALAAAVLGLCGRHGKASLARYRLLKRVLVVE